MQSDKPAEPQREPTFFRVYLFSTIKLNEATRRGQPKFPQNLAKRRISPKSAWWTSVSLTAVAEVHENGWKNPPAWQHEEATRGNKQNRPPHATDGRGRNMHQEYLAAARSLPPPPPPSAGSPPSTSPRQRCLPPPGPACVCCVAQHPSPPRKKKPPYFNASTTQCPTIDKHGRLKNTVLPKNASLENSCKLVTMNVQVSDHERCPDC